jgi:putative spermidine/putrescine transport system permease protein
MATRSASPWSGPSAAWRARAPRGTGQSRGVGLVLMVPSTLLVGGLLLFPLTRLIVQSVTSPRLSLHNYTAVAGNPTFWKIALTTMTIAAECTVATLVLAYPLAFALASLPRRRANVLLAIVLVPFWTSILVRMYAWLVLLGPDGLATRALRAASLTNHSSLLYGRFAVIVGMTHYMLPFMILSLYATMVAIDPAYVQAARTMGSSTLQAFRRVYWPLSLSGVYAGTLLVFILSLGFYVTPALIGGPQDTTLAMYLQQQVELLNWGQATAMAVFLLVVVIALFWVFERVLGIERLFAKAVQ